MTDLFTATVPVAAVSELGGRGYDAVLSTLGYETRCTAVATHVEPGTPVTALAFSQGEFEPAYQRNARIFKDLGAGVVPEKAASGHDWALTWLATLQSSGARHVAVDISSTSRARMASVLTAVLQTSPGIVIDFLYVPERYVPAGPPPDATESAGPIAAAFAGWIADPRQPLAVIFGLGYEPTRAAGALDYLEPTAAIPFMPRGGAAGFEEDVLAANHDVFDMPHVHPAQDYLITDPEEVVARLEALISWLSRMKDPGAERGYRALLLPFGPKIFALCCLIAAVRNPDTPVWRVTPGRFDRPVDRQPGDQVITLRVSRLPLEPRD